MKTVQLGKLWFTQSGNDLLASGAPSDTDVVWDKVATLPIEHYDVLAKEFDIVAEQFQLAKVDHFIPPSGQIYILTCPTPPKPPKNDEGDGAVREVTTVDQPTDYTRFKPTYVAVVKAS